MVPVVIPLLPPRVKVAFTARAPEVMTPTLKAAAVPVRVKTTSLVLLGIVVVDQLLGVDQKVPVVTDPTQLGVSASARKQAKSAASITNTVRTEKRRTQQPCRSSLVPWRARSDVEQKESIGRRSWSSDLV